MSRYNLHDNKELCIASKEAKLRHNENDMRCINMTSEATNHRGTTYLYGEFGSGVNKVSVTIAYKNSKGEWVPL